MKASSKILASASAVVAAAMMFGSWAPLEFRSARFADVLSAFLDPAASGHLSRSDTVANTVLGIPLAFTFTGFLATLRASLAWRCLASVLALLTTAVISLACEIPQGWLVDRVPSIADTRAQLGGAVVGIAAWWIVGPACAGELDRMVLGTHRWGRVKAALGIAAGTVFVWSILPGKILVSPADYARKWTRGQIEPIPFSRPIRDLGEAAFQWGWTILLGLPLGLWAYSMLRVPSPEQGCRRSGSAGSPSGPTVLLWLVGLGILPELLQIPVARRFASATDALFMILGTAAGYAVAGLAWEHRGEASTQHSSLAWRARDPSLWFVLAAAYLLFLCALSWIPFEFVTDPQEVKRTLREVAARPFGDYRGSNLKLFFNTLRTALLGTGWGTLLGVGIGLLHASNLRRWMMSAAGCASVGFAFGIELGQLLEASHSGGALGALSRLLGMWTGLTVAWLIVRPGPTPQ
ncbi:hypothetical protein FYK55_05095 [Roseiconus nitratireducens]|uniref:VanZ like protein n=1 Tax=Roseiconus nitratireducens TaxID=2605748 RepID=A0A5M6DFC0_9BACT|nr:hypothetical protein [Roseiconus nitratireducens]KAA5546264.1 hypothetical protein FYK55_05095 [Roseiconus nitratireducens]